MSASTADLLAAARRRDFVGRREELALLERLLDAGAGAVVHVQGPGGIGKSSLLHQYHWIGAERGRTVVRVDAADLPDVDVPRDAAGLLLLVDRVEQLTQVEDQLLRLPADAVVVLAGRSRPGLGWRTDPGWRSLLHSVRLRELDADDSRELLRRRGVSGKVADAAEQFARGHPLALALAAELGPYFVQKRAKTGGEAVHELLAVLLDTVPTPLHRTVLEAASQVLVTTESLLEAIVPTGGELFDWLRGLPVVEYTDRGVRPHDLLRDLLAAELHWRDPEAVTRIRRRAREWYHRRLDSGERVLFDLAYLHRDSPLLGPFLSCVTPDAAHPGDLTVTPMRPGEWPLLRSWLVRHEGQESATLVERWVAPDTVSVVRDEQGDAVAFMVVLALDRLDPVARAADPATAAAWRHARGHALHLRCWLDAEHYQDVSPAQTLMIFRLVRLFLSTPGLTHTYLPVADPQFWAGACQYIDLHRLPEADFTVAGRHYGVYGHDWQAVPPALWLQRLADGEHPGSAPGVSQLDEAAFSAGVRDALRQLGRPDRLAGNPLAASALTGRAGSVEKAVRDAAAVLRDSPRDRRAYRALHHTYLQPAGTQQAAADLLDLPLSTYRRHLAEGVERLTELLWRQELAGRAESERGSG